MTEQRTYSLGDYFVTERMSDIKHEYYDGAIYAMAGGSPRHSRISRTILIFLERGLSGSSCEPFGSDLRIYTPSGLYTYPDVTRKYGDTNTGTQYLFVRENRCCVPVFCPIFLFR